MKPAQVVIAIWTLNIALLVTAALLLGAGKSQADRQYAASRATETPAARVAWNASAASADYRLPESCLSPRARPASPEVEKPVVVEVVPEPTDEELLAELQLTLNRRYALQRTVTWVDGNDSPGAFLLCGRTRLFVFEGMNLDDLKGAESAARGDVQVKSIAADHVVVNAPSLRKPDRRFDVRLDFAPAPATVSRLGH